jgi:hypothetical protein
VGFKVGSGGGGGDWSGVKGMGILEWTTSW